MNTHSLKKSQNMTQGNVRQILVSFAIPLMLGNLLQQIYSMVDTVVVGQGVSYQALAAVGVAFPVVQLFLGIGIGLSNGLSVVIAQKFGSGDYRQTRKAIANGIYLSALGNSRIPLLFLMITSLLNVFLDILFVMCLGWGVAGAAVATVISQIVSCVLCFLYICKNMKFLRFETGEWKLDLFLLKEHVIIGTPLAFFDCILYISFLLLQAPLNSLGSVSMAAYTAASKIDSLVMRILNAFGTTISTFVAQNKGNASYGFIYGSLPALSMLLCWFPLLRKHLLDLRFPAPY